MGASVRPEGGSRIERNIASLRSQGATEHDVEAYLTQHEGLKPTSVATGAPSSKTGAAISGMASGATLGFADEALGAVEGANQFLHGGSFSKGYQQGRDQTRAAMQEGADAHPIIHGAGALAGGLATAGVGAGLAKGSAIAAGAKVGGVVGGLSGVGNADGDLSDRVRGGLVGGASGAVLGAVAAPVVGALSKVGGKVITALGARPSGLTAEELAADAATLRKPLGPQNGAGAPIMAQSAARAPLPPMGTPTIGQQVRAPLGSLAEKAGIESSKTRALRLVGQRLESDNVAPADAVAYVGQNARKPLAALDLGGGNVAGLARTAKDVPGLGRKLIPDLLHSRSSGNDGATMQRITQDFEDRIGLKPEDYYSSVEDMTGKMKAQAQTDYDKVRGKVIDDPEVLSMFDIPEFRPALKSIAQAERIRPGGAVIKPLSSKVDIDGEASRVQNPQTIGTLDKLRQYVGDVARGKLENKRIDKNTARAMLERIDAATERMDTLEPDYAKARSNYRGSAEGIDAYEAGKDEFLKQDPRLTTQKIQKMPDRLKDLYRRGGYDALRSEKLSKMDDGANIGAFLEKNPDIRDKVAALAKSPEESAALRNDLGVERAMGDRKAQILGGPNTAERLIEHEQTTHSLSHVAHGGIRGVAGKALDAVVNRTTKEGTQDVMGEVAKYLTRSGPEGIQTLMDEIGALKAADAQSAIRSGARVGARAGQLSGSSRNPLQKRR